MKRLELVVPFIFVTLMAASVLNLILLMNAQRIAVVQGLRTDERSWKDPRIGMRLPLKGYQDIAKMMPIAAGQLVYCQDCSDDGVMCVSTATSRGSFMRTDTAGKCLPQTHLH